MTQRDNCGWQARIGMFIVGREVVPDAEWWAMVPLHVSVHAARVTARARWRADHSGVELEDDLLRGCRQFAPKCLSAVLVGHSSSSILGGPEWDEAVVETLSRELGGEVAVTTNGLDCVAALQASGVNRPFLVFPPWFDDSAHAGPSRRGICVMIPADNGATCHLANCIGRVWASSKRSNRCTSRCEWLARRRRMAS